MPYKHQDKSYRNKGGLRYQCWIDAGSREEAQGHVKNLKAEGYKSFYEGHPDGYFRVFYWSEKMDEENQQSEIEKIFKRVE